MTSDFTSGARRKVEAYVGRSLTSEELVTVASVAELSAAQKEILDGLARRHRLAAVLFLQGVVEGIVMNEALAIIDHIRDTPGPQ